MTRMLRKPMLMQLLLIFVSLCCRTCRRWISRWNFFRINSKWLGHLKFTADKFDSVGCPVNPDQKSAFGFDIIVEAKNAAAAILTLALKTVRFKWESQLQSVWITARVALLHFIESLWFTGTTWSHLRQTLLGVTRDDHYFRHLRHWLEGLRQHDPWDIRYLKLRCTPHLCFPTWWLWTTRWSAGVTRHRRRSPP